MGKKFEIAKDCIACGNCEVAKDQKRLGPAWDVMVEYDEYSFLSEQVARTCLEAMAKYREINRIEKMTIKERKDLCSSRYSKSPPEGLSYVAIMLDRSSGSSGVRVSSAVTETTSLQTD